MVYKAQISLEETPLRDRYHLSKIPIPCLNEAGFRRETPESQIFNHENGGFVHVYTKGEIVTGGEVRANNEKDGKKVHENFLIMARSLKK